GSTGYVSCKRSCEVRVACWCSCEGCTSVPHARSAPLPLVGRGWGWGSESEHDNMSTRDEPRVWAKRDRSVAPRQRQLAREMRSAPTEAERKLWWHLRHRLPTRGTHFRRQVRIGRYIVDFACHARRLVIESMVVSTERDRPLMTTAREFSKQTAIACCAIGTTTCCRISMACSRTF